MIFVWNPKEAYPSLSRSEEIFCGISWSNFGIKAVEIHEPQAQVFDEIQKHESSHQSDWVSRNLEQVDVMNDKDVVKKGG